jgi:hypothetical protein
MSDERMYGLDGWDTLEDDLDDVVDRAVEDACETAWEGAERIMGRMQWPLRVWVYRRMPLPTPERLAERILTTALNSLDEEYGDPDGRAPEPTPAMQEPAMACAKVILAEYKPWACEPTGEFIEITQAEAQKMVGD